MAKEGSTKPTYSELEAENLRVRGLLQRIVSAHTLYNNRLTGETMAILADTIREAAAESADIGKLDTADKWPNASLGSMYEHPVPSEPFPLPGSAETGGEKAE